MPYARRGFKGGVRSTTLNGAINDAVTTIAGADLSTWTGTTTNGAATATISRGQSDEETITFTGVSAGNLTGVTRGAGGTTAQSHASGATLEHTSSVTDFDEANAHIADTTLDHHTQYLRTTGSRVLANTDTAQISFRINAPSGQAADLIDAGVNGSTKFDVDQTGLVRAISAVSKFGAGAISGATGHTIVGDDGAGNGRVLAGAGQLILKSNGSSNVVLKAGDDSTVLQVGGASGALTTGFFGATAVTKPTGVAVTAAGIHAALVTLGLIAA